MHQAVTTTPARQPATGTTLDLFVVVDETGNAEHFDLSENGAVAYAAAARQFEKLDVKKTTIVVGDLCALASTADILRQRNTEREYRQSWCNETEEQERRLDELHSLIQRDLPDGIDCEVEMFRNHDEWSQRAPTPEESETGSIVVHATVQFSLAGDGYKEACAAAVATVASGLATAAENVLQLELP